MRRNLLLGLSLAVFFLSCKDEISPTYDPPPIDYSYLWEDDDVVFHGKTTELESVSRYFLPDDKIKLVFKPKDTTLSQFVIILDEPDIQGVDYSLDSGSTHYMANSLGGSSRNDFSGVTLSFRDENDSVYMYWFSSALNNGTSIDAPNFLAGAKYLIYAHGLKIPKFGGQDVEEYPLEGQFLIWDDFVKSRVEFKPVMHSWYTGDSLIVRGYAEKHFYGLRLAFRDGIQEGQFSFQDVLVLGPEVTGTYYLGWSNDIDLEKSNASVDVFAIDQTAGIATGVVDGFLVHATKGDTVHIHIPFKAVHKP